MVSVESSGESSGGFRPPSNIRPVPNPDSAELAERAGEVLVATCPIMHDLVAFDAEARGDLHGVDQQIDVEPTSHDLTVGAVAGRLGDCLYYDTQAIACARTYEPEFRLAQPRPLAVGSKRWRITVEAIAIGVRGDRLRRFRSLQRRASTTGEPWSELIQLADEWYPALEDEWLAHAEATDAWRRSRLTHTHFMLNERLSFAPAAGPIRTLFDARGLRVGTMIESGRRSAVLRVRFLGHAATDAAMETIYKPKDRLTWLEFEAGVPCRGCDRPIQLPGSQRLSARGVAAEARWWRRHSETCSSVGWSICGSPVSHCHRCCPPPPFSPGVLDRIGKILAPRTDDLLGLPETDTIAPRSTRRAEEVKRLGATAASLGYLLTPAPSRRTGA